ncbi:MAG: DNA repair protein RecO [Spirochaetales bacterium]|jgi:DNA repair protein RecO (recombination protein O)|nr:DNA repair protein RecO [Spirochaetales bacterium]
MERSHWREVIVLHCRRIQEFHKAVICLDSAGEIRDAVLHGAYKGKNRLSGSTEPFCRLRLLIYHDPVKNSSKISDGELLAAYPDFRGHLAKVQLAGLWGELLLRTGAGGNREEAGQATFRLLRDALGLLGRTPPEHLDRLNGQFLWRFLQISGFGLDYRRCRNCGANLAAGPFYYDLRETGFLCGPCAARGPSGGGGLLPGFSPETPAYLDETLGAELGEALSPAPLPPGVLAETALLFLKTELAFSPKTPDYRKFLD